MPVTGAQLTAAGDVKVDQSFIKKIARFAVGELASIIADSETMRKVLKWGGVCIVTHILIINSRFGSKLTCTCMYVSLRLTETKN